MYSNREKSLREKCVTPIEFSKESIEKHNDAFISVFPSVKLLQEDPLDNLLKDPNSNNYHSDVWLLMNEERLRLAENIGIADILKQRFDQKPSRNLNVTDEVLFQIIPSRRLDSLSERFAFVDYIEQMKGVKSEEMRKALEEEKAKQDGSSVSEKDVVPPKTE